VIETFRLVTVSLCEVRANDMALYTFFLIVISNQVRLPAELKHISKRRKRN
jgi:hypothetical protein